MKGMFAEVLHISPKSGIHLIALQEETYVNFIKNVHESHKPDSE
jgi:hypothetical protein